MIKSIYLNRKSDYLNEKLKVYIKINLVNFYYINLFNYTSIIYQITYHDKMITHH